MTTLTSFSRQRELRLAHRFASRPDGYREIIWSHYTTAHKSRDVSLREYRPSITIVGFHRWHLISLTMAPIVAEIEWTKVFIRGLGSELTNRCLIALTPKDVINHVESVPYYEPDYTTSRNISSYYESMTSASTAAGYTATSLVTIIISEVATITSTSIALMTSESTIAALAPTEAPLTSAPSATIIFSPGQIAGIVVGAITGLLFLVLLFYLLLTREKWVARIAHLRLKKKEQVNDKKPRRGSERNGKSAGAPMRKPAHRKTVKERQAGPTRPAKTRPAKTRPL
ncbi:hypothetical protein GGS21DRAFT_331273 [Xylaria nigripes]|nr:hypothetical protein GGS21DRAFT_331273 [Xylaria nigripes]